MSNHITVIDIVDGDPTKGFAVRVGPEFSKSLRLANCIYMQNGSLVKVAGSGNDYAGQQNYTRYNSYEEAIKAAKSLKALPAYSHYKVRVDATIA